MRASTPSPEIALPCVQEEDIPVFVRSLQGKKRTLAADIPFGNKPDIGPLPPPQQDRPLAPQLPFQLLFNWLYRNRPARSCRFTQSIRYEMFP
jgi:hypothetical protein